MDPKDDLDEQDLLALMRWPDDGGRCPDPEETATDPTAEQGEADNPT